MFWCAHDDRLGCILYGYYSVSKVRYSFTDRGIFAFKLIYFDDQDYIVHCGMQMVRISAVAYAEFNIGDVRRD